MAKVSRSSVNSLEYARRRSDQKKAKSHSGIISFVTGGAAQTQQSRQPLEFLQQALMKLDRETRDRIATVTRDLSDARGEIATLKSTIEKLNRELAQMKAKTAPSNKKF